MSGAGAAGRGVHKCQAFGSAVPRRAWRAFRRLWSGASVGAVRSRSSEARSPRTRRPEDAAVEGATVDPRPRCPGGDVAAGGQGRRSRAERRREDAQISMQCSECAPAETCRRVQKTRAFLPENVVMAEWSGVRRHRNGDGTRRPTDNAMTPGAWSRRQDVVVRHAPCLAIQSGL